MIMCHVRHILLSANVVDVSDDQVREVSKTLIANNPIFASSRDWTKRNTVLVRHMADLFATAISVKESNDRRTDDTTATFVDLDRVSVAWSS